MLIIKAMMMMDPNNCQTDGNAKANILAFEGGSTGTGLCFSIPSDKDANTMCVVIGSVDHVRE
jgi:hypothetical protein